MRDRALVRGQRRREVRRACRTRGGGARQEGRAEVARLDDGGVQAERGDLGGERLGDALEGELGGAVDAVGGVAVQAADGGDVEDGACALGAEAGKEGADGAEDAEDVDVELFEDLGVSDVKGAGG